MILSKSAKPFFRLFMFFVYVMVLTPSGFSVEPEEDSAEKITTAPLKETMTKEQVETLKQGLLRALTDLGEAIRNDPERFLVHR